VRIVRIRAYRVALAIKEGAYRWATGKSVEGFDATVVRVDTDAGLDGWGESCPLGPAYLPAHAGGVRAGLAELAPAAGTEARLSQLCRWVLQAERRGVQYALAMPRRLIEYGSGEVHRVACLEALARHEL